MITLEAWLQELEWVAGGSSEGLSAQEIAQATGRSLGWVRQRLRILLEKGRLHVGYRTGTAIDGKLYRLPVYRLEASSTEGTSRTDRRDP